MYSRRESYGPAWMFFFSFLFGPIGMGICHSIQDGYVPAKGVRHIAAPIDTTQYRSRAKPSELGDRLAPQTAELPREKREKEIRSAPKLAPDTPYCSEMSSDDTSDCEGRKVYQYYGTRVETMSDAESDHATDTETEVKVDAEGRIVLKSKSKLVVGQTKKLREKLILTDGSELGLFAKVKYVLGERIRKKQYPF